MEVRNLEQMRLAVSEFRGALGLDPDYARASAALSLALTHTAWLGEQGIDVMAAAKNAAMKALTTDDTVALAHTALACVFESFEYDYMRSQSEHLRAMALDDQDLWVLRAYASFLMRRDAFDEALEVIRQALELDPASPLSNRHHAMILYTARRYDECVAVSHNTLPLDPNDSSLAAKWLAKCLEQQGQTRQAVEAYERGRAAHGNPGPGRANDAAARCTRVGIVLARASAANELQQLGVPCCVRARGRFRGSPAASRAVVRDASTFARLHQHAGVGSSAIGSAFSSASVAGRHEQRNQRAAGSRPSGGQSSGAPLTSRVAQFASLIRGK
jgi:tetratricopeptide (TPR) repeat protein